MSPPAPKTPHAGPNAACWAEHPVPAAVRHISPFLPPLTSPWDWTSMLHLGSDYASRATGRACFCTVYLWHDNVKGAGPGPGPGCRRWDSRRFVVIPGRCGGVDAPLPRRRKRLDNNISVMAQMEGRSRGRLCASQTTGEALTFWGAGFPWPGLRGDMAVLFR